MPVDRRRRSRIELAQQQRRLRLAQLRESDPPHHRSAHRSRQTRRRLRRPKRQRQQDVGVRATPKQPSQKLDRRAIAPVQIIEQQHQRSIGREQLEQLPHRSVSAVSLVSDRVGRSGPSRARHRRQHAGELSDRLAVPRLLQAELLRGDVSVESVDPDAERQIALELGRRPGQHETAPRLGAIAQLTEQARLADSRLALQRHADQAALRQRVECRIEQLEL